MSASPELVSLLTGVVSFGITYLSIPSIVAIAREKKVFDEPSQRKSHIQRIPTLGGVAIFAGFTVSAGSFISYSLVPSLQYILVACIIIFFVGMKDDLLGIAPGKKLLGQIAAALVLIVPGLLDVIKDHLYLTSLHGFMGISHISPIASIFLTTFVIVVVINSFNLIDGVDGLAASIGMLTSAFFGVWFFLSGNIEYSLLSVAVFGTLLAFFRHNVFGKKSKIFMGDTGSLLVGLLMSVQVILFNEKNIGFTSAFRIESAPAVSFVVLIVPLYDTIRVFIIRLSRGRSPFSADKNHVHHLLLKLGYTHVQTTMLIVLANICFITLSLFLQNIGIFWLVVVVVVIATTIAFFLENRVRKMGKK
jgi:UDP-N-acetylmuramyl pentapeptide phosphotransferase/UDP-N-acetylglucosamine-1-phosphate transferase